MECHVGFDTNYSYFFFLLSKFGKAKGTEMLMASPKKKKKTLYSAEHSMAVGLRKVGFLVL